MRELFQLDPNLIYLNAGTHSICPTSILEAITRYQLQYEKNPTIGLVTAWDKLWQIQKEIAPFFHADPKDLFLRPNVTLAMNAFLLGVPLTKNREILVSSLEYPAIKNLARRRAELDNLEFRIFELPKIEEMIQFSETEICSYILDQITPKTELLVLSHIFTSNGFVLPIEKIAKETKKLGIILVVDGAHAAGAIKLDFTKMEGVDFYASNFHKWMLGPKGTGFGWVSKRLQSALFSNYAGWTTYEAKPPFENFGEGSYFQRQFLISSCIDFAPYFALHDLMEFWRNISFQTIQNRIVQLQNHLIQEIENHLKGFKPISVLDSTSPNRGPLFAYQIPSSLENRGFYLLKEIYEKFQIQVNVVPLNSQWVIRFSPHIYNNENEITLAIQRLKDLKG